MCADKPIVAQPALDVPLAKQLRGTKRRRQKAPPLIEVVAAKAMRKKGTVPRRQVSILMNSRAAIWTGEEKREIAGLTAHPLRIVQKKILHNRTATEKGCHALLEVLDRRSKALARITCSKCGESTQRANMVPWMTSRCEPRGDMQCGSGGGRLRESEMAKRKMIVAERVRAAGHIVEDPTADSETLKCSKCLKERTFRRHPELAKIRCSG